MSDKEGSKNQQFTVSKYRKILVVLCVIILVILIAFAVAVILLHQKLFSVQESCNEHCASGDSNIYLDTPKILPPFHDLTRDELMLVRQFLYTDPDLNLVHAKDVLSNRSFIFTMELHVPQKEEILAFLDDGGPAPVREASVVIFRGDKTEPVVQEFIVGPLPEPTYKRSEKQRSFLYRPLSIPEFVGAVDSIRAELQNKIGHILKESYGGSLENCGNNCLDFQMMTPMPSEYTGEPMKRKMWFWLAPVVEFWSLHPLNFIVLMDLTSPDVGKYFIDKVYYGNQLFNSVDDLKTAYEAGSVTETKVTFPTVNRNLFSSVHRRGTLFPEKPLQPPREFEPTGKRYSINGRHIKYMGWEFDIRMSSASGPQIFDIKYNAKRIVYELSLQEIAVFYSANSPALQFADYLDSLALIGSRARALVSGADCPEHSTFLGTDVVVTYSEEPAHFDRAFCVFEHNTGVPLRRHLSYHGYNMFYEGMMDIVLTVRTITAITNYDYIIDFIFHQNGALEVKVLSSGYILTTFGFSAEDSYGFRLRDHLIGNVHHHMFHFKVDMDIFGTENRFETLEIVPTQVENTLWSKGSTAKYSQTKLIRKEIKSEKKAALKYNFKKPKYLTFYNNKSKTTSDVPRSYRLFTKGNSNQVVDCI